MFYELTSESYVLWGLFGLRFVDRTFVLIPTGDLRKLLSLRMSILRLVLHKSAKMCTVHFHRPHERWTLLIFWRYSSNLNSVEESCDLTFRVRNTFIPFLWGVPSRSHLTPLVRSVALRDWRGHLTRDRCTRRKEDSCTGADVYLRAGPRNSRGALRLFRGRCK